MSVVLDLVGAVCLVAGALLCLTAAIGLLRFPDVLSRMHAATKPQTLGLLLILLGVGLSLRSLQITGVLILIGVLQVFTAPVAAHLVARTAYRSRQFPADQLVTDELAAELRAAGFTLQQQNEPTDDE